MAQYNTKNTKRNTTNYSEKLFQGTEYSTVDEAIDAGAKAYAKLAWTEVKNFMDEFEDKVTVLNISDEEIATALVASKRKVIVESMTKRDTLPSVLK